MKYTVDCTRYTNCNYSIQKVHVLTFSKVAANPFWSVTNGIWWTKPTFGFFSLHARSRMISDEAVEKGEKKKIMKIMSQLNTSLNIVKCIISKIICLIFPGKGVKITLPFIRLVLIQILGYFAFSYAGAILKTIGLIMPSFPPSSKYMYDIK